MVKKEFKVGEKVFAKWPGSSQYYEAVVDEIDGDEHVVSFTEGSLTASVDVRHIYSQSYFGSRSKSSSPARKRSRSPARRRSRSRSPARRSTSTPKRSPRQSPTRRSRSPGRPRKQQQETKKEEDDIPASGRRGRPRKQDETPAKETQKTPAKQKHVASQQSSSTTTHITRSMTKTMVKEEKDALLDPEQIKQEIKESRSHGKEFEFGGPVGVFLMMIGLPVLIYAVYFYCNGKDNKCTFRNNPIKIPHWRKFFGEAHLWYDCWLVFQVLFFFVPIGKVVEQTQTDGTKKPYRLNGLFALVATLGALFAMKARNIPLSMVYDQLPSLITAAMIWGILIALFVYVKARREETDLASDTGNVIYDFFIGHQKNPCIGKFDFKFFCETRPSLLGWMVINFCMANQQYENFGKISPAMWIVCFFQFVYVLDVMIFEKSLLTQIDFTHEGFGFMLSFGNLAFVPFIFSLQARYLADHNVHVPWPYVVAIVVLKVIGYIIFRGSNLQKDCFRQQPNDPDFQDKETILTPSGKRLMVFGWWRMVRHPNYLGDILMAISWSLPCGFTHIVPWIYPIYLAMLLVHRQRRDDAICHKKYGKSYDEYCRRVPYRIIPNVY